MNVFLCTLNQIANARPAPAPKPTVREVRLARYEDLFADGRELSVPDLVRALGISRHVVTPDVATLVDRGLLNDYTIQRGKRPVKIYFWREE